MDRILNKIPAANDELFGAGLSGALGTSPLWLTPVTEWLQLVTLIIGAAVGITVCRLNITRRNKLEDEMNNE